MVSLHKHFHCHFDIPSITCILLKSCTPGHCLWSARHGHSNFPFIVLLSLFCSLFTCIFHFFLCDPRFRFSEFPFFTANICNMLQMEPNDYSFRPHFVSSSRILQTQVKNSSSLIFKGTYGTIFQVLLLFHGLVALFSIKYQFSLV